MSGGKIEPAAAKGILPPGEKRSDGGKGLPNSADQRLSELSFNPTSDLGGSPKRPEQRQLRAGRPSLMQPSKNVASPASFAFQAAYEPPGAQQDAEGSSSKGSKRKRLAKACDACHKSKRRCDGTAPCSNCFFASKTCTYTDSSGRTVPAPHPGKPEAQMSAGGQQRKPRAPPKPSPEPVPSQGHGVIKPHGGHPSGSEDQAHPRKKIRSDRGHSASWVDGTAEAVSKPASATSEDRLTPIELDAALTHELTNLFFTHCHPARYIIHKPNFSASLSHNRVPTYLLYTICALAAPLSKQPRLRTSPPRFAGNPFAQEALSLMFDGAGRLLCEPNLATAQALCLLRIHECVSKEMMAPGSPRYHDLAMHIIKTLGLHSPEHPTLTPVPSPEFIHASIERECIRRIFWLIHMHNLQASIYFRAPFVKLTDSQLKLRLPSDETSFELGVHSTLPGQYEFLYHPPVRTQCASEVGHLIRVMSIFARIEHTLDELNDPDGKASSALAECERLVEDWASSLPEHLRFSEQSLQVQQSMFETCSNTGAWAFCCLHVYHASCAIALTFARQRISRTPPKSDTQWATARLDLILDILGERAKKSALMGAVIWPLIKYNKRDDPQILTWCRSIEDMWGIRIKDLIVVRPEWGSQPSQYPVRHLGPFSSERPPAGRIDKETGIVGARATNDGDIDPALQQQTLGGLGGVGSGVGGRTGESLPSLKSSGLLDSWNSNNSFVAPHSRIDSTNTNVRESTRTPTLESDVRSTTMPVGLQWLANESR